MSIEVERKFAADTLDLSKLIRGAKLIKTIELTDTYYDDFSFKLTTRDMWLRKRNGFFELKASKNRGIAASRRLIDRYEEIENDDEIRTTLGIAKKADLETDLKSVGIVPFCTIKTTRKKYKKDGFAIDIDQMDFGYNLIEIELMAEDEAGVEKAAEKITDFAQKRGLEEKKPRGKLIEYLFRNNKDHYNKLVEAGVE